MIEWEKINGLDAVKAKVQELLTNAAEETDYETVQSIIEDAKQGCNKYTQIAKKNAYELAKASGDPIAYAAREYFYETIRIKETKDKETGIVFREIKECERGFDLVDIAKKLDSYGRNPAWVLAIQKLNGMFCVRVAHELGVELKNKSMRMAKDARDYDLGKNPCSNTKMGETLNTIVGMMIGDQYKCTTHDVRYLMYSYGYDDKRSKTAFTVASHKEFRTYIKKILRHILTGESYDITGRDIVED